MSQIMMTLIGQRRAVHSEPHASFTEPVIASLSADPETIEELNAALKRFLSPDQRLNLDGWPEGPCEEPVDAGLCLIDLPARLVVLESTYSLPGPEGEVFLKKDDRDERMFGIPYHLSKDWNFLKDRTGWEGLAEERRRARDAQPPLDTREVIYGQVAEFIAVQCFEARAGLSREGSWSAPPSWWRELPERASQGGTPSAEDALAEIHARWLMTPREDLRGASPRDCLLEKNDELGWELQDREVQWGLLDRQPPALDKESFAYRFAGFGTHEYVLYYELVRHLLERSWERVVLGASRASPTVEEEVARLNRLQHEWLTSARHDDTLHDLSPAAVIEQERARVPLRLSGEEAVIDADCPLCQMNAEMDGPLFWHLDGCNMDDDFPFSFCATREEWEEERREREEFDRRFEAEWKQREAEEKEADEFLDGEEEPSSPWKSSFSKPAPGEAPEVVLIGIGGHLAEVIGDLKQKRGGRHLVEKLNRHFGNLRTVASDPSGSLLEPVVDRFCEELREVSEASPELAAKCSDLEAQLQAFARGLQEFTTEDTSD